MRDPDQAPGGLPQDAVVEQINRLSHEEEELYAAGSSGAGLTAEQRERLHEIKVELDQSYDLLHQYQALSDAGLPPSEASPRPPDTVEGYEQ